jgi:uncharacterized protein
LSPASSARRGLILLIAAMLSAAPAAAQIPRQDPKACKGQKEIRPLEPLSIRTDRGVRRFMVEVADSPLEREYGLMCRRAMADHRGMLFVFPQSGPQAFWMRNTLIPLDIVYIGSDGTVVSITRNAQPLDERPLPSAAPAKYVLELNAGLAAKIGLLPGDRIMQRAITRG